MTRTRPTLLAGMLAATLAAGAASASQTLEELGVDGGALTTWEAEHLLERYVRGEILTFAAVAPRIELLEALLAAAPEDSTFNARVELLLQSARSSSWPRTEGQD